MYRLVLTSTDGMSRFYGWARPLNGPAPSKVKGVEFDSIAQVKSLARRALAGERTYERLAVVDKQGAIVASAVRAGFTGKRWQWDA
jgi:hypothetical protein